MKKSTWRRIRVKRIRKNTAGRKSGRAKIFTPFLRSKFAGPSPKTLSSSFSCLYRYGESNPDFQDENLTS